MVDRYDLIIDQEEYAQLDRMYGGTISCLWVVAPDHHDVLVGDGVGVVRLGVGDNPQWG